MIIKTKSDLERKIERELKIERLKSWRKVFTFVPIKIDNEFIWMEFIEERFNFIGRYFEYRKLEKK